MTTRALQEVCDDSSEAAEAGLLRRSRAGDTVAFGELITLHRQKIYMQIYMIVRNEEDAMDLCQETFLRAWKSLAKFDGKFSLLTWLRRIATNASIDLCRTRQRRPQVEIDGGPIFPDAASRTTPAAFERPGDGIDRAALKARLEAAFEMLSPEHRAAISLKEFDGLSYEEIAKATNSSLGTVMSRLHYARKKLQSLLADLRND
ncbi:MAG: sigma-70 family RNA polymerase sigma factor [Terrimicrobiaceae bacterium]